MEADGNYTEVHFTNGQKLLLTKKLKAFSQMLEASGFLRLRQSHLENFSHIREFVKTDGGYLVIGDGVKVPVAVRKLGAVVERLER